MPSFAMAESLVNRTKHEQEACGILSHINFRAITNDCKCCVSYIRPDLYAFRPRSLPSVVEAIKSSVRVLSMCAALAEVAGMSEVHDA